MIDFGSVFGKLTPTDTDSIAREADTDSRNAAQTAIDRSMVIGGFLSVLGWEDDVWITPALSRSQADQMADDWQEGVARKFKPIMSGLGQRKPLVMGEVIDL